GGYRLIAAANIQDVSGNALDGNLDGVAGDDAVFAFASEFTAPVSEEYRVDSGRTLQASQAVAMDDAGNYVVAWSVADLDGSDWGVFAQRFSADGEKVGGEFQVNTFTDEAQALPAAAMDADGDFVIAWASYEQDSSNWGIYAQRYSKTGAWLGSEFRVNTTTANSQLLPAIAMSPSGQFVITWSGANADETESDIYGQRFAANGNRLGSEFQVNTTAGQVQGFVRMAMDDAGNFVVTWTSLDESSSTIAICGQRFNAVGEMQGPEFCVDTDTLIVLPNQDVAMDSDGDFVITWQGGGDWIDVYAQRYDADGSAAGSVFRVNSTTSNQQQVPTVAMDAGGNFVIAWWDSNTTDIHGQRYAADGAALGSEFTAMESDDEFPFYITVVRPRIAMNADGEFVLTADGHFTFFIYSGVNVGVWARLFGADGTALGDQFPVHTVAGSLPYAVDVAADGNGGSVVAWADLASDDPAQYRVFARRYLPGGTLAGLQIDVALSDLYVDEEEVYFLGEVHVATDGSGGFVVAWSVNELSSSDYRIFARRFDSTGAPEGDAFLVTQTNESGFDMAMDDAGSLVFTYVSHRSNGGIYLAYDVWAIEYHAGGFFSQWSVNSLIYDSHYHDNSSPTVDMAADGRFVIAWEYHYDAIGGIVLGQTQHDIRAQRYNALGSEDGDQITIVSDFLTTFRECDVAVADDGRFVVVWKEADASDPTDGTSAIMARQYDAGGTPQGSRFQVNTNPVIRPNVSPGGPPNVGMSSDGDFVVAWTRRSDTADRREIAAQRFDASGGRVSGEFQVNALPENSRYPAIAVAPDGDFVVAWNVFDDGRHGIYARNFAALQPVLLEADGVLRIQGTGSADSIIVSQFRPAGDSPKLRVSRNGAIYTFSPAEVSRIVVNGLDGNDMLTLTSAVTVPGTLNGGSGNDYLEGGAANDIMNGGVGNDTYGFDADILLGRDTINETDGHDTLDFSGTSDLWVTVNLNLTTPQVVNPNLILTIGGSADIEDVIGGDQGDALTGNSLGNRLVGNGGNDVLVGGGGNDLLYGNAGNDRLNGGPGNDTMAGGAGNDTYVLDTDFALGVDIVDESAGGIDTLDFFGTTGRSVSVNLAVPGLQVVNDGLTLMLSAGNTIEHVIGGSQNDFLTGNALDNSLTGNDGDDVLTGGGGNDELVGGDGNDQLDGGVGNDILNGGTGDDRQIGGSGNDSYVLDTDFAAGTDVIDESAGGTDALDFSSTGTRSVAVNLGLTSPQVVNGNLTLTLLSEDAVESVWGGNRDDTLIGNGLSNSLAGNGGN
ncbi:MAG: hypothetical protein KDA89_22345, partial [Planctomycetaceae bacterium]|nr:hypothetical protein [Planctomycetaceae bacterium]